MYSRLTYQDTVGILHTLYLDSVPSLLRYDWEQSKVPIHPDYQFSISYTPSLFGNCWDIEIASLYTVYWYIRVCNNKSINVSSLI